MFQSARIRLTIWYLTIIMFVSVMFSLTIYRILTSEFDREATRISERYERQFGVIVPPGQSLIEPEIIQASENRIKFSLIYVNLIIFAVAGVGGYILAGVTLKPIQEMLDEQKRFTADASHELRTPLTSLKSEIEVYLRGKNHSAKEAEKLIESNLEEVNKLQNLSEYLIQLSKTQDITKSSFEEVSVIESLTLVKKIYQKLAKQKAIEIVIAGKDNKLFANKETLTQLFGIFIDNAIKYSPSKTTVKITTKKVDHTAAIAISDEGVGIPEKDIPYIFGRFYRADTSRTKQQTPGYGLGLSIAKNILDIYKGKVTVKSTLGKGTTFTILLPIGK